jgi:hypothetical protein
MSGGNSEDAQLLAGWFANFFRLHQHKITDDQRKLAQ